MKRFCLISLVLTILIVVSAYETSAQTRVRVRFARGATSATLKGTVRGYGYIDYFIRAGMGQTMSVNVYSPNEGLQFVVFNSNYNNMEGSFGDTYWSSVLPYTGDYIVRVLLQRSEARRRGSMANYTLKITIY